MDVLAKHKLPGTPVKGDSKKQQYEISMLGLGVMGRNLLLNMADHGHSVAGYDKDSSKVDALHQEAGTAKFKVRQILLTSSPSCASRAR